MAVFWELRDRHSLPKTRVPQNREICAHLRWTSIRPYTCIFELCYLRLWWQWHWIYHIIQLNGWIGWESGLLCEISDWVKVCDVGFYWIHPGLDSKEVARPRLDSVHQEESNRCFAGKWGESRGLGRRRGGGAMLGRPAHFYGQNGGACRGGYARFIYLWNISLTHYWFSSTHKDQEPTKNRLILKALNDAITNITLICTNAGSYGIRKLTPLYYIVHNTKIWS